MVCFGDACVQVKADVTEGSTKLAEAIGGDTDAVICATGFRPSLNLLAPWQVSLCTVAVNINKLCSLV